MRIKIGQRFRDYTGVPYLVKSYKNSVIEFEVDGQHIEKYTKSEFVSELNGNRFHEDLSPVKKEISDEEIEMAAYEWCKGTDENGFVRTGDDYDNHELPAYIAACKWYREQLKRNN
jgi:hypothetical protein